MASERETALNAVIEWQTPEPPKLDEAISRAEETKQLQLKHQYAVTMKNAELGWFGRVFGAQAQASIVIAFIVVVCGLIGSGGLWWIAYKTGNREFWSGEAHIALGAVTTALGYVFGRGSKEDPK